MEITIQEKIKKLIALDDFIGETLSCENYHNEYYLLFRYENSKQTIPKTLLQMSVLKVLKKITDITQKIRTGF